MNLVYWAVLGFLGLASAFFSGAGLSLKKDSNKVSFFAILALLLFGLSSNLAYEQGNKEERVLNSAHTYLVIEKGQSSFGTPLHVYDENSKDESIIVVKEYPPDGLIEVTATDGKVILIPAKKK